MPISLGIKVLIIAALGLFLLLPLSLIDDVIRDRQNFKTAVEHDIARTWTGSQAVIGPVLTLPYEVEYTERRWVKSQESYITLTKHRWEQAHMVAQDLNLLGEVATEVRYRGIYSVPVYTGNFEVEGQFSQEKIAELQKNLQGFTRWGTPVLSVAIQDIRGIGADPSLHWDAQNIRFKSGSMIAGLPQGIHAELPALATEQPLAFKLAFDLRGSQMLSLAPMAMSATAEIRSAWPHPNFSGRFLPATHDITAEGFTAQWATSALSTDVEQSLEQCIKGDCSSLQGSAFNVQFIETVNIYQKVRRATKYGVLFIVLTFVAFFLTETLLGLSLHPLQYALVGGALAIFYLLLISLSEHIGFAAAYVLATGVCVSLIGFYLAGVLGSRNLGVAYGAGITLLYGKLFAILHSEDFALLMGSLLLFAMLAAVMILTRKVDWYGIGQTFRNRNERQNNSS